MRDSIITPRRTTHARRRRSQPQRGLGNLIMPGMQRTWRAFWQGVEHPHLVKGAVLLFPTLTLLLLSHLLAGGAGPAHAPSTSLPPPPVSSVAQHVQAFYQGDPNAGWDSRAQYDRWWQSACAPAALTMALRAWGTHVHIGQVLDRLIALKAMSPSAGLLRADALTSVAKAYGFQGITFWKWTLQNVAYVTGQGVPVLVDVVDAKRQTPYPGFFVGHWLVVVKVTANQVEVRDSSGYHIHSLSLGVFHQLFTGIGAVVWQGTLSLPREG